MPNDITPNPTEYKTVRIGVRCGGFILVYERIEEKPKPVTQMKDYRPKRLTIGGIDTYA